MLNNIVKKNYVKTSLKKKSELSCVEKFVRFMNWTQKLYDLNIITSLGTINSVLEAFVGTQRNCSEL